jgi:lipopolysaccharide/colanic/teichoic acid biosynthesis glycosyltransferase
MLVGACEIIVVLIAHYWKYATNLTVPVMEIEQRENAQPVYQDQPRSEQSIQSVKQSVLSVTTEEDYQMLRDKANLNSRLTKIVCDRDRFSFLQILDYQYTTIVDMTLLNDAKGINKRFCLVNQKLPDNGRYVCCYRPQEYIKQKILNRYPKGINWIVYSFYFLRKRIIPRLMLTSRLYYDLTKGRKRMLSKTEVLGRLYYCGFEVDEIVPMGHIEYIFAHRKSQPYPQEQIKLYGPLIKLPRVCKNKEIRYFYKMRTMHPYAEYIQKYVYDMYGTTDGDKAVNDFRITTWGRFMRKYWMDELPMILNILKGDMKLVGVRPLSKTKFDTYPEWLQDLRTKAKPGLVPPFYVDMPQTQEEMFDSEARYLRAYLEHPIRTDWSYFWKAFYQIVFKHARSK